MSMTALQTSFESYIAPFMGDAQYNAPLAPLCSFKIGGPAEILYTPYNEEALLAALRFAKAEGCACKILGNGTNLLISDKGVKGIVLRMKEGLTELTLLENGCVFCGAGVSLKKLCTFALDHSLTGLEFAYGIPGSVGGAVYMNAGAYKGEIKDVLYSVRVLCPDTMEITERRADDMDIAYRSTPFMGSGEIIVSAVFALQPGDPAEIRGKMNELMGRRKASQPLEYPSAGSTFKRPAEGYAAAMIDQSGLKGFRVGGAEVSTKHAGFVINTGNATFDDVMGVIAGVRDKVRENFGVTLETEVEIWGEN